MCARSGGLEIPPAVSGRFSARVTVSHHGARARNGQKTAEESAHGRDDGSSVRNDPSITPGGRVGRGKGRTHHPRARPREAYFVGFGAMPRCDETPPLAESQFWPFNRLPWLGHARLDFGKLNGQRAVPCPRGGVCALRAPRNAASRFWPFFGVAGRFSPLRARAKRPKTAEESAHGRNDGSSVRNDPSITPGGRAGRGRGRTRRPRARPREAYFMGLKNEIGFKKCLSPASSIE